MAPKRITPPPARKGKVNRFQLSHKPRVDSTTFLQLQKWQASGKGVSLSVLLDRLVAHAKRTKFNPALDCL